MIDEQTNGSIVPLPDSGELRDNIAQRPRRIKFIVRETGDVVDLPTHRALLIGRNSSTRRVDFDLTHFHGVEMGISRCHAEITPTNDSRIMVKDLGSTNGTRLNGEKLEPEQVYEVRNGDTLKLGRLHLIVELITAPLD